MEASDDLIGVADLGGRVLYLNQGGRRMIGFDEKTDIKSLHFHNYTPRRWQKVLRDTAIPTARAKGYWQGEMQLRNMKTGAVVDVMRHLFLMRDPETGVPVGLGMVTRDITALKSTGSALAEHSAMFDTFFNEAPVGLAFVDREFRFIRINEQLAGLSGLRAKQFIGWTVAEKVPTLWPTLEPHYRRALAGKPVVNVDVSGKVTKEGKQGHWLASYYPVRVGGTIIGVGVVVVDVTDLKRAHDALRDREERLRAILDTVPDAVITVDRRGIIVGVNPATEQIFNYREIELLGEDARILMPSSRNGKGESEEERRWRSRRQLAGSTTETHGRRRDGRLFPAEVSVGEVDHLGLLTGVIRDITERKRLEHEVLRISDQERQRVAADLHDGICQELSGISFAATALQRELEEVSPRLASKARELAAAIDRTVVHTRSVARGMSPVVADGDALMHGLRQFAEEIARTHRLRCLFQCRGPVQILDTAVANQLYRIAQEAVHNAVRHANASRIVIQLRDQQDQTVLVVRDNGRGIPKNNAASPGLGLHTMQYRAGLIHGRVDIHRSKRSGTEVFCRIPKPNHR